MEKLKRCLKIEDHISNILTDKAKCKHAEGSEAFDWVFPADANMRIKVSQSVLDNYQKYSLRADRDRWLDMTHRGIMHISGFSRCETWQNHAWGWIEEVDAKGVERNSPEWRRRAKEAGINRARDLNFKGHTWWRLMSDPNNNFNGPMDVNQNATEMEAVEPATGNSTKVDVVYETISDFISDNIGLLDDMAFNWTDWRLAAMERGFSIGDMDEI